VTSDLAKAFSTLENDLGAMVGGATDGATRNHLATDAGATLNELSRHPHCYATATDTVWEGDLDYLAHPWLPTFTHAEAARRLAELLDTPLR
jgi:hypothetical protein